MLDFMQLAYEEAKKGVEENHGGPFGAVIVKDETVIAKAHNEVLKRNDPTAHAEILAIQKAAKKLQNFSLKGCILYTTGEPCPMCYSAIQWARLDKVVFCNTKEDAASIGFDDSAITEMIQEKILSPVQFIHRPSAACSDLLRLWDEKEDKIPY